MTRIVIVAVLLGGCGVKPWQRERLARPKMQLERDALASEMEQQVYETREGSVGGHGGGGGGCGCN